MNIFRKRKFYIRDLYVVTTENSDSNILIKHYKYDFTSISVVSLKGAGKKTCRDIISGEKYYIFDNNDSIKISRIYCSNIWPLYNFFVDDNKYEKVFKYGIITLDELCMFLTEMNNYFYVNVLNHINDGCYA